MMRARYPGMQLIENHANLGFAAGDNVGIRLFRGDYVIILDDDAAGWPRRQRDATDCR